ncbi:MAG: glycosyltransferase family 2 protein [Blastocatellales bacterium]
MKTRNNSLLQDELLVSVIISTYNRCDALVETLHALGRQTVPPDRYEVIVVDDGSSDDTFEVASGITLPCDLRVFRHEQNRGVSAGRNLAMSHARGKYLILVSDDLIVPENFIATHLDTLERYPGFWVVGGLEQLPSLRETSFGRYLDDWEQHLDELRKHKPLEPGIWEMAAPTARNLSLPREDYLKVGPFDEQFRTTCEDQDWAHRATEFGIKFLYNTHITCLHNDQAGDLLRQCRFQERGAHDTVLLCFKYPGHRSAPIVRVNGYLSMGDSPSLTLKKLIKLLMATSPMTRLAEMVIALAETRRVADPLLWRLYRALIGLYIFRGWRRGLRTLREREGDDALLALMRDRKIQHA